jgi:hypothetical protein
LVAVRALLPVLTIAALVSGCSGRAAGKADAGDTDAAAGTAGGGGDAADAGGGSGSGGDAGGGGAASVGGAGGGDAGIVSGFSWRTLPSLTTKRQNAMGAAVGQTMYVIGGLNETGLLTDVESLAPGESAWTTAPALPDPQCCAAVGALGNVIAVAGGYGADGHTPTNTLLLFDTVAGTWQTGAPMPTARANSMGAVWNGKLAVIGGGTQYGATQATGVIEIYDPTSNSWAASALVVTPRAAGVAVADSDRIYVIGGAIQSSLYGDPIVEVVTSGAVVSAPSLGLGRAQVTGGLLPAGPVVAGGWTAAGDTPTIEGLLGARTAWQSFPPMPTSRAGAASAVIDGSLIVAGGGQYSGHWVAQTAVEALAAD